MKGKLFELAILSSLFGGGYSRPQRKATRRTPKNFKRSLQEYYTPPRSMTAEEKEHYDKHKNLNGFYK